MAEAILEGESAASESLREAQQMLIDLGYLEGKADGLYGPKTARALEEFQTVNDLPKSGILDDATQAALTRIADDAAFNKRVQQRLIDLGYLQGQADGIFGPRSADALSLFQRLHGLEVTGFKEEATIVLLFSDSITELPSGLDGGDRGDEVERLQKMLIQYGFLSDSADGVYGKKTAAAVSRFQEHLIAQGYSEGVSANGTATPITLFYLYSDGYTTYVRDIQPGETSSEVLRIEKRLAQLGYMDCAADETFDDYALAALNLFREQAGLKEKDVVEREAIDALFGESAPKADHFVPHAIASGDSGLAVRACEEAMLYGGITTKLPNGKYDSDMESAVARLHAYLQDRDAKEAALFADAKALSIEAQEALAKGLLSGDLVSADNAGDKRRVQRRLHTLYYLSDSGIDGKLGTQSRKAISEFQAANGLEETGDADAETLKVLFSDSAVVKPYPYRVEVSIARQTVEIYALNDKGDYSLARSFHCSTGLNNTTPRGIFLNGFPVNRWHFFAKFNCWAQYSYEVVGDIMFHSVLYSQNDERTLRESSVYALGSPASHGCIRLEVEDAKWLYEHCKRGTVVIVIS